MSSMFSWPGASAVWTVLVSAFCLSSASNFNYQSSPESVDYGQPSTERIYGDFLIGSGSRTKSKRNEDVDGVPKLINYVLNPEYLRLKNKSPYLITRDYSPDDAIISDNVIVESNVLHLVRPGKRRISDPYEPKRRYKRGYNLEYVRVPNVYPYVYPRRYDYMLRRYPSYW